MSDNRSRKSFITEETPQHNRNNHVIIPSPPSQQQQQQQPPVSSSSPRVSRRNHAASFSSRNLFAEASMLLASADVEEAEQIAAASLNNNVPSRSAIKNLAASNSIFSQSVPKSENRKNSRDNGAGEDDDNNEDEQHQQQQDMNAASLTNRLFANLFSWQQESSKAANKNKKNSIDGDDQTELMMMQMNSNFGNAAYDAENFLDAAASFAHRGGDNMGGLSPDSRLEAIHRRREMLFGKKRKKIYTQYPIHSFVHSANNDDYNIIPLNPDRVKRPIYSAQTWGSSAMTDGGPKRNLPKEFQNEKDEKLFPSILASSRRAEAEKEKDKKEKQKTAVANLFSTMPPTTPRRASSEIMKLNLRGQHLASITDDVLSKRMDVGGGAKTSNTSSVIGRSSVIRPVSARKL